MHLRLPEMAARVVRGNHQPRGGIEANYPPSLYRAENFVCSWEYTSPPVQLQATLDCLQSSN